MTSTTCRPRSTLTRWAAREETGVRQIIRRNQDLLDAFEALVDQPLADPDSEAAAVVRECLAAANAETEGFAAR